MNSAIRRLLSCRPSRHFCTTADSPAPSGKAGGFAQAFVKLNEMVALKSAEEAPPKPPQSFHTLLRKSTFMEFGDPHGKVVLGKVFRVVDNDLYVNFGGKFPAVVSRPNTEEGNRYVRGTVVRLRLKELEMSQRFLGSITDMSLNEAEATLLSIQSSPVPRSTQPGSQPGVAQS